MGPVRELAETRFAESCCISYAVRANVLFYICSRSRDLHSSCEAYVSAEKWSRSTARVLRF